MQRGNVYLLVLNQQHLVHEMEVANARIIVNYHRVQDVVAHAQVVDLVYVRMWMAIVVVCNRNAFEELAGRAAGYVRILVRFAMWQMVVYV